MSLATQLIEERETLSVALEQIVGRAEQRGSDLTDDERAEIKKVQERCAAIDRDLTTIANAQEARMRFGSLTQRIGAPVPQAKEPEAREATSLGDAFVNSAEFRNYHGSGTSGRFEFRAPGDPVMTSHLSLAKQRLGAPADPNEATRYPLFGLVNVENVSTGAFEYVATTWTDAAAVVAEGAQKPQATMTTTLVPGTVDTVAEWVPVTRQALEDGDRLRSIIDGKLTQGIRRKQHALLAAAISGATGVTAVDDATDLLTGIRQAIAVIEDVGWFPNVVLLNPADYAAVDIAALKATTDLARRSELWGLRVVQSSGQTAGTATVGDFLQGVTMFNRAGVSIYATDSHGDTFTKNIITILGEARSSAVVTDKTALATVTVAAP